jgi:phenol 2-monooxygenase
VGPEILKTYNIEREKVAEGLSAFGREFSKICLSKAAKENSGQTSSDYFIRAGRHTAGLTSTYSDSTITSSKKSVQSLANNIVIGKCSNRGDGMDIAFTLLFVGMRFLSAPVIRFCDARAMQLTKALLVDGRWRIVAFTGKRPHCPPEMFSASIDVKITTSSPILIML